MKQDYRNETKWYNMKQDDTRWNEMKRDEMRWYKMKHVEMKLDKNYKNLVSFASKILLQKWYEKIQKYF